MTDILFCGDAHGRFEPLLAEVAHAPPAAIVLLGDMEAPAPLDSLLQPVLDQGIPVHWIPGNHDTDTHDAYDNLYHSKLAPINLHGKVVCIDGIRIAGLGGVFREKVWNPDLVGTSPIYMSRQSIIDALPNHQRWRGGIPLRHRSTIFPEDYQALLSQRADILVTHEAPNSHEYGYKAIGCMAGCLHAHQVIHGHHHVDYIGAILNGAISSGVMVRGVGWRRFYRLEVELFKSKHGIE